MIDKYTMPYKSPVVYWRSEWIDTGETEIRHYTNNIKKEVKKRKLVGELNKNFRGKR